MEVAKLLGDRSACSKCGWVPLSRFLSARPIRSLRWQDCRLFSRPHLHVAVYIFPSNGNRQPLRRLLGRFHDICWGEPRIHWISIRTKGIQTVRGLAYRNWGGGFLLLQRIALKWSLLVLVLLALPVSARADPYQLNAGDVLDIAVWKEESMQRQVLILPDGTISFPLAGHLAAAGRTAAEVQDELVKRIKTYIPEPVVTVSVASVGGNAIYVIGQVKLPGRFNVTSQIDVMQALSLAGGLTPFGDEDGIKVLRRENNKQTAVAFDYSAVKKGKKLEANILLRPGDVVVVPD